MVQSLIAPADTDVRVLPEALRPVIELHRDEADALRRLPAPLVDALRTAGAFRLTTPRDRGGFEASLATMVDVYEDLGRLDGPVAWNIWNGNIGFAAALLDERAGDEIWAPGADPIIANSARPAGVGSRVGGGYSLSGRWDIVSAIDIADWVALFGIVPDGGAPEVRVFFVRARDVEVLDTWHTHGMRGTGSNTVVVDGVFIPEQMTVSPFAAAWLDRPLFRIPPFTLASTGSAPIVVGIAEAALDELIALAPAKGTANGDVLAHRTHAQTQIAAAQMSLHGARLVLRDAAASIDAAAAAGDAVTELLRARLRAAMSHAALVSRDVLAACQLLASSTAIYTGNTIERLVRDGQTATQHVMLSPTHFEILGRLTFGLDAGTPVV